VPSVEEELQASGSELTAVKPGVLNGRPATYYRLRYKSGDVEMSGQGVLVRKGNIDYYAELDAPSKELQNYAQLFSVSVSKQWKIDCGQAQ